jgi:hypothetical protein
LIVDAQSVKNADTAGQKGYDAGKKVSGIKRHIAVDTQGLPHAAAVTPADVTDRKGALQALERCRAEPDRHASTTGSYIERIVRPQELRQHLGTMQEQWRDRGDGVWKLVLLFIEDMYEDALCLIHPERRN